MIDMAVKEVTMYTIECDICGAISGDCVKSSSPTYWNLVRKTFPDIYNERAEQSRRIGAKLVVVKGKRKFLDELKPTDKGGKIKSWDCGIFCDM